MSKDGEKEPLLQGKPGEAQQNGGAAGAAGTAPGPFLEPPPRAAHKVKRKITVEPAVVGFFVAVTAANPLNQQYLHARFSYQLNYSRASFEGNDSTECGENYNIEPDSVAQQVQALTSFWTVVLLASDLLPGLITTILLGPYCDKAGRKKAMVPPLIGGTIRTLVGFLVVAFNLPVEFFFVGTIAEGLSGGPFTMMMASLSYMADVTTKRQRPLHLLGIEICSGLGTTAANVAVGYMIQGLGFKFPYLIILGIFILTSIYVICFLPETIDKRPDAKLFTCENLQKGVQVMTKPGPRRWKLLVSLVIFWLIALLDFGGTEIVTFYLLNPPLCWGSVLIAYYLSEAYIVMTIGSVIFVKFLFRPIKECGLIIVSCLSGLIYYVILAGARNNLTAFMGTCSSPAKGTLACRLLKHEFCPEFVSRARQPVKAVTVGITVGIPALCQPEFGARKPQGQIRSKSTLQFFIQQLIGLTFVALRMKS